MQKVLAHAGIGSRRACEELILQGRVTVGGKTVTELGTKVDPGRDVVAVDGQRVRTERFVYFAVHKPKGYVSTNNDPSGRPRVVDLLPEIPQRVYTVGRLDEMSVGLILLTNDGELANRLSHPRFGVEKIYRVVVAGSPARDVLDKITEGVWLAEGKVRAKRVRIVGKQGESTILEMVLSEGKNREVRRMLAKFGHKVMSLTRTSVGPIGIRGLAAGQFRSLTHQEVQLLQRAAAGEDFGASRTHRGTAPAKPRPARPSTNEARDSERRDRPKLLGDRRPTERTGTARPPIGKPAASRAPRPPKPEPRSLPAVIPISQGAEPAKRKVIGLDLEPRDRRPRPQARPRPGLGAGRPSRRPPRSARPDPEADSES